MSVIPPTRWITRVAGVRSDPRRTTVSHYIVWAIVLGVVAGTLCALTIELKYKWASTTRSTSWADQRKPETAS